MRPEVPVDLKNAVNKLEMRHKVGAEEKQRQGLMRNDSEREDDGKRLFNVFAEEMLVK